MGLKVLLITQGKCLLKYMNITASSEQCTLRMSDLLLCMKRNPTKEYM